MSPTSWNYNSSRPIYSNSCLRKAYSMCRNLSVLTATTWPTFLWKKLALWSRRTKSTLHPTILVINVSVKKEMGLATEVYLFAKMMVHFKLFPKLIDDLSAVRIITRWRRNIVKLHFGNWFWNLCWNLLQ